MIINEEDFGVRITIGEGENWRTLIKVFRDHFRVGKDKMVIPWGSLLFCVQLLVSVLTSRVRVSDLLILRRYIEQDSKDYLVIF